MYIFKSRSVIRNSLVSLFAGSAILGASVVIAVPWFSDDLEAWVDADDAVASGPWSLHDDNRGSSVEISGDVFFSGSKSLKVCYLDNEHQSFLAFDAPNLDSSLHEIGGTHTGVDHLYLRWQEYRPTNFDWAGEKFNRIQGVFSNGNVSLDYPLGWASAEGAGGFGAPGTTEPGAIQFFGNSQYSNPLNHFSHNYVITREEWHVFELEIRLNTLGKTNGSSRLWIDDVLVASAENISLREDSYTLDRIWMGGWYSGIGDPDPSPACRYIDDVMASDRSMTGPSPNPPTISITQAPAIETQ